MSKWGIEEIETLRKIGNSDFSSKPTNYYNLDMIINVGYKVNINRVLYLEKDILIDLIMNFLNKKSD